MSVLRLMRGVDSCHQYPNGSLPSPESFCIDSHGPMPARLRLVGRATTAVQVPLTRVRAGLLVDAADRATAGG